MAGPTALMYSCQNGHELCARALLEAGVRVDAVEPNGASGLLIACQQGKVACCNLLIGAHADINLAMHQHAADDEGGFTPLVAAAQNGHDGCARALLEAGARKDLATAAGSTALSLARSNGHAALCALLEG